MLLDLEGWFSYALQDFHLQELQHASSDIVKEREDNTPSIFKEEPPTSRPTTSCADERNPTAVYVSDKGGFSHSSETY